MFRRTALLIALCSPLLRADSPALTIIQQQLPSPAPVGAAGPLLVATPAGPMLTWIDSLAGSRSGRTASTWETASARWSALREAAAPGRQSSSVGPGITFPDGSSLIVFFPEKDGRILDLHTQRRARGVPAAACPLSADSWLNDSTPADAPLLVAHEARVIAVWVNRAETTPRLFAALSTSAGTQFFLPVRIDDSQAAGRASAVMLRDGSAYVSWVEKSATGNAGNLWLRRLSPSGEPGVPVLLASARSPATLGHPQLAIVKDYDATPAQLLVAHELAADSFGQIVTRLITLPPAESFLIGRPCATCPPDEATLPGHSLIGRVIKLTPRKHQVIVDHREIPGILPAGKHLFRIDDPTLASLHNLTSLLARIEQRDGTWWLFDVRKVVKRGGKM